MVRLASSSRSLLATLLMGIGTCFALTGCQSTATEKLERRLKPGEPVVRVFPAKYEEVEAALKQAMLKYPQRVDNTEAGIFETDFVKGEARFQPAHKSVNYSSGYRYRMLIRLVRGKAEAKTAVKVVVVKQVELVRDFFAEADTVASDGLEENAILYRIDRELKINRAIQRANEKQNKKSGDEQTS